MTIKWNFGPAAERARFNLKGKTFNLKLKKKNSGPARNRSSRPQASSVKQSPHLNDINKPERNNYVNKKS